MTFPGHPPALLGEAPKELNRGEVGAIIRAARAYKLKGQPTGWKKTPKKPTREHPNEIARRHGLVCWRSAQGGWKAGKAIPPLYIANGATKRQAIQNWLEKFGKKETT